jgi:hypothetical protein
MALLRRTSAGALLAIAIVLGIALSAGSIRLLPWLFAQNVPLEVSFPFGRVLVAVALEAAVLVGVPVGVAVGTAVFVERGEARALLALGVPPHRVVASGWLVAWLLALSGLGVSLATAGEADAPGRLARGLIEVGRKSCNEAQTPEAVLVPLVDVTWLCFPGRPPRVVAPLPGSRQRAWFSATELLPSPDLTTFHLRDLNIAGPRQTGMLEVRLHADRAKFAGFSPWVRATTLPRLERAAAVACAAALVASAASWLLVARVVSGRLGASLIAIAGALASLALLQALERAGLAAAFLSLLPVAGIVGVAAATAAFRGVRAAVIAWGPRR